jgi:hypothetical protein
MSKCKFVVLEFATFAEQNVQGIILLQNMKQEEIGYTKKNASHKSEPLPLSASLFPF